MNKRTAETAEVLGCSVLYGEPLKNYTTFRVGGSCSCMIKLNGTKSCSEIVGILKSENEPYFVLGRGSNVIARDSGYDGTILLVGGDMAEIHCSDNIITAQAGASLNAVCRTALGNGLTGLEFASGIPGTVGGGVYMNAGAYGGEIKDVIEYAEAVERSSGRIVRFSPSDMDMSYRHSVFMNNEYIITEAAFCLNKGDTEEIKAKMNELLEKRRSKQPLEYPSAGSTFKRPQGSYASLLIEQCGLKGLSVGGAEVSTKHSGFIINKNNASAEDILRLIDEVRRIVGEKTGFVLECEPIIL